MLRRPGPGPPESRVATQHAIILMGLNADYGLFPVGQNIMYVEFFGVPRERAGMSGLEVQADTLGQLLGTLAVRFPSFEQLVFGQATGVNRLHPAFVANLNGERFVSDPGTPLAKDDCVLILSADAGG